MYAAVGFLSDAEGGIYYILGVLALDIRVLEVWVGLSCCRVIWV